jgi:hypothetical protein
MKSVTIGWIPTGWSENEDGGDRVDVGDVDFSQTEEINLQIEDDEFEYGGSTLDYNELHDASTEGLKGLVTSLKNEMKWDALKEASLAKAFGTINDEYTPKRNDDVIKFFSSDGPEIVGAKAYQGHFYLNLWDDDSETEALVVFA